ncbi:solute carrier family 22 member 4-like [Mytilus edulis]|uniref:solute carrier family 22 member 4-like n=1 Tax=Mytilus edulis TaxID=6550 RepID=UPI0039EEC4FF
MSLDLNEYLENLLLELGGLGRFQFVLTLIVYGSKATIAWSTLMMSFGGAIPDWTCTWKTDLGNEYISNSSFINKCSFKNNSDDVHCDSKAYDTSMSTIVSEWSLVCDREWIISTITTIQMGGLLIGAFISGQVGDVFGRKPAYYASIIILLIFNVIAAFSVSWQMFAVLRFLIGMGCGWYLTIDVTYMAEFTPAKYRSLILALPMWPLGTVTFALFSWLLHDWKYIQIASAIFCLPWFIGVCIIPESYRWLVSVNRIDDAHDVIKKIGKMNRRPVPKKEELYKVVKSANRIEKGRKRTFLDVFRNRYLFRTTVLLGICWITCGYGFYAISFGVQQLSGNIYLNIALLGMMEAVQLIVAYATNRLGRKWTTLVFFVLGGLTGLAVGVLQFLDIPEKGRWINGFALTSKLCVSCGWMALIIFTSELYPTVVRNVGYGINNTVSRIGSMVAPQLVYASKHIPGLMYLLLGGLLLLSALCILLLNETNKLALKDTIEEIVEKPHRVEKKNESNNTDEYSGGISNTFTKDEINAHI